MSSWLIDNHLTDGVSRCLSSDCSANNLKESPAMFYVLRWSGSRDVETSNQKIVLVTPEQNPAISAHRTRRAREGGSIAQLEQSTSRSQVRTQPVISGHCFILRGICQNSFMVISPSFGWRLCQKLVGRTRGKRRSGEDEASQRMCPVLGWDGGHLSSRISLSVCQSSLRQPSQKLYVTHFILWWP